jgi:hypothetical protein
MDVEEDRVNAFGRRNFRESFSLRKTPSKAFLSVVRIGSHVSGIRICPTSMLKGVNYDSILEAPLANHCPAHS